MSRLVSLLCATVLLLNYVASELTEDISETGNPIK